MKEKMVYNHPEGKLDKAIALFCAQCCPVVMTELRLLFYSEKLLLQKQISIQSVDRCIDTLIAADFDPYRQQCMLAYTVKQIRIKQEQYFSTYDTNSIDNKNTWLVR